MNIKYSTHMPVLLKVMRITSGPVLEMGVGICSTPLLHYFCRESGRFLMSYDSKLKYINEFTSFNSDTHKVEYIEDWDKADILKPWSVAFIDHHPHDRRAIDAGKLSNFAEYIICHDSELKHDFLYKYSTVYNMFKYRLDYNELFPNTVVLSNFHDLKELV